MDIYCSGSILLFYLLGLFQADNKGETGVMGFPGPRVSTDTYRHFFSHLSLLSSLVTEAALNVLGAIWCRWERWNKGMITKTISSLNSEGFFFFRRKVVSLMSGIVFQGDRGDLGPKGQGGLKVR